jgi:hypothetical protein
MDCIGNLNALAKAVQIARRDEMPSCPLGQPESITTKPRDGCFDMLMHRRVV